MLVFRSSRVVLSLGVFSILATAGNAVHLPGAFSSIKPLPVQHRPIPDGKVVSTEFRFSVHISQLASATCIMYESQIRHAVFRHSARQLKLRALRFNWLVAKLASLSRTVLSQCLLPRRPWAASH